MGIIRMIDDKVLGRPCEGESKAFFVKMVSDYYRYIAENAKGDLMEKVKQNARSCPQLLRVPLRGHEEPQGRLRARRPGPLRCARQDRRARGGRLPRCQVHH